MKNFAVILLAVLLFCSCKKDKKETQEDTFYFTADKNGVSWTAESNILGIHPNNNYALVERKTGEDLIISFTINERNQYVLVPANTHLVLDNESITRASYLLDENASNLLNITNFDAEKKIIKGTLKLTFIKLSGPDVYPATITFTNGKFRSTVLSR